MTSPIPTREQARIVFKFLDEIAILEKQLAAVKKAKGDTTMDKHMLTRARANLRKALKPFGDPKELATLWPMPSYWTAVLADLLVLTPKDAKIGLEVCDILASLGHPQEERRRNLEVLKRRMVDAAMTAKEREQRMREDSQLENLGVSRTDFERMSQSMQSRFLHPAMGWSSFGATELDDLPEPFKTRFKQARAECLKPVTDLQALAEQQGGDLKIATLKRALAVAESIGYLEEECRDAVDKEIDIALKPYYDQMLDLHPAEGLNRREVDLCGDDEPDLDEHGYLPVGVIVVFNTEAKGEPPYKYDVLQHLGQGMYRRIYGFVIDEDKNAFLALTMLPVGELTTLEEPSMVVDVSDPRDTRTLPLPFDLADLVRGIVA